MCAAVASGVGDCWRKVWMLKYKINEILYSRRQSACISVHCSWDSRVVFSKGRIHELCREEKDGV